MTARPCDPVHQQRGHLITVMLVATMVASGALAELTPSVDTVTSLADRILECRQESTGAIFLEPLVKRPAGFVPYFAHFAAYGLLRAYEVTDKREYLQAADAWIDWYRSQQRPDGTLTDYTFNADDTLSPTDDMDSTDSYAAMYLWVVAERERVSKEPADWLRERELSCFRALSAILLTMQDDGLTTAKPSYPIEYAMDNAEVVVGFRSAALTFDALGNPGMAGQSRRLAERTEAELRTFYSAEHGYFAWHRDLKGQMGFRLDKWYPDVMAQVLVLMRVGRPEELDRSVFARVARDHLVPSFKPQRPQDFTWYGLAAQRLGIDEWIDKIVTPLNKLQREQIADLDSVACGTILEAITGGTRP